MDDSSSVSPIIDVLLYPPNDSAEVSVPAPAPFLTTLPKAGPADQDEPSYSSVQATVL